MTRLVKVTAILSLVALAACGAPRVKEPCGIDQTGQPGNCDRTRDDASLFIAG